MSSAETRLGPLRARFVDRPDQYRRALIAIVVLAAVVRIGALMVQGPKVGVDSTNYLNQGAEILRQGPLSFLSFVAEQSPLYSLLFALCAAIAGPRADWLIGIVQALLGALTALLLAQFTASATHDRVAGVLAGVIAAIHVTFIFWTAYVLTDTLLLFVLALVVWRLPSLGAPSHTFMAGLTTSALLLLFVLTRRTNALASGVLVLLAGALGRKRPLVPVGLGLPVAAVVVMLVAGSARSRTGSALGEHVEAYIWQAFYMGLQWTEEGRATEGVDIHLSPIVDDAERGVFYRDSSLAWLRADPGYFFSQAARKIRVLWAPFLPEDSTGHKVVNGLYLLPLYALGVLGWLSSRRNGLFLAITTVGLTVFTLVCVVTFVDYDQRYRLPAELFLIPLSAVGLARVLSSASQMKRGIAR